MLTIAAVWARSGEAGERWSLFPIYGGGFAQNVIFTRNPNVAYLTIDVGGPYRSDDGCRTWRPLHGNLPYEMRLKHLDMARSLSADPRDENNIVCAAGSTPDAMGGIIVSRDGGRTWHQTAVGNYLGNGRRRVYGQILDRNPSNPDELVVGGDCTGLMKSTDNGETWRPVGLDDHWFCCVFYDRAVKGRVWACAPGYEDVPSEAEAVRKGRDPNPKPRYGRKRGLYRSDDGGETWTRLEMKRIPTELCQIAGSTRVLGIFDEQDVRATEDGGATWREFSQGLPRLAPGDMNGTRVFRRGPEDARWTAVSFKMGVVDVVSGRTVQASIKAAPGRPGWFFASSGEGRGALFRSMDGGRTFVKMAGPVGLFAPLAFDLHCPGSFLAAGSGTVYVTQDDGAHFSTLPGGFDYPSSFEPQFFLDRGRVWAFGGAGNGAWVYQDGAPIYPVSGN